MNKYLIWGIAGAVVIAGLLAGQLVLSYQLVSLEAGRLENYNCYFDERRKEYHCRAVYRNCTHAKQEGVAPLKRGERGYGRHLDGDDDGSACE